MEHKQEKYEAGLLDYCEGCEEYIDQIDLGEGIFGCPICKTSNSILTNYDSEKEHKSVYDTGEDDFIRESLNNKPVAEINQDLAIQKAEENFLEDDKLEPFSNREYVKETKRIYSLLEDKHAMGDFDDPKDRAIFDVVNDILLFAQNQLN